MRIRPLAAAAAAIIWTATALEAQTPRLFRQALNLYENGAYTRAARLFERLDGPDAAGYKVLCDVKSRADGFEDRADLFLENHPESILAPQIQFAWGQYLFDEGQYAAADRHFTALSVSDLYKDQQAEYLYKRAYSCFAEGNYPLAESLFNKVEALGNTDYAAPAQYSRGFIRYSESDFAGAFDAFEKASKDARFAEIAHYYMLECRFLQKDYDYVVDRGTDLFGKVPEDRQPHLARILSEAYLVKGDVAKAREYYEKNLRNKAVKNRSDYFYAGSVLYAVEDWQGAIDNYSRMTERTDSLGQVANYQMGYSYIETRNKVAAMEAFKEAAAAEFDPRIREDAYYIYAKLAFDLNHDTSAFEDYLQRYGTRSKGDRIYSYMAMAALYNHDYEGAVAAYDKIDELDADMRGNYMKAYFMRANQLIGNGAWRDAVPCLKAAAYYVPRQNPFNQLSRYWLAESLFRNGDYKEARDVYTDLYNLSALDGKPEGDLISYHIGYTHFKEGDYATALRWFRNYLEGRHDAFGADAETRVGDCYFFTKDYRTAISAYERKLSDYPDPDDIYPYFRAGVAAGLVGETEEKVRFLETVKSASPSAPYYSEALYELGRAYVAAGSPEDAVRAFRTLRSATSDNNYAARALIELGMIARNQDRYAQALEYYKEVVETMSGSDYAEDALLAIESIYQLRQEPDAYLAYVESLGDKSGRDEGSKDNMYFSTAEEIFLSGNYPKAQSTFEAYLARFPKGLHVGQASYYLGECCKNLGRTDQAVDWYGKAVESGAEGSFLELSMLNFSMLSYQLGRYNDAFGAYSALRESAKLADNVFAAKAGMMRSAYKAKLNDEAIKAAEAVKADKLASENDRREADAVKAKALLASSRRSEAFAVLQSLSAQPSTPEGAEATYMIIQDLFDQGRFDAIEDRVYDFSGKAGGQNYWLAKAFIVLGDAFLERGNAAQARVTWESVKNGYRPAAGADDDILDQIELRLNKLAKNK